MPRRVFAVSGAVASFVPFVCALAGPQDKSVPLEKEYVSKIKPLVSRHCVGCHGGDSPAGGLGLDKSLRVKDLLENRAQFQRLVFNVKSRSMPPNGGLKDAERATIQDWFERALGSDCQFADAGHVTLRRLNQRQYQNSVSDLLGIQIDLTKDFPSDDVGNGFDNIGDVLTVSPLLLEKYLDAAEKAVQAAIVVPHEFKQEVDLGSMSLTKGVGMSLEGELIFTAQGEATKTIKLAHAGSTDIHILAWAHQAGPEKAKVRVRWDQTIIGELKIDAPTGKTLDLNLKVASTVGAHTLGITFSNDFYNPQDPDPEQRDRNLFVSKLDVSQPRVKPSLPNGPITSLPISLQDLDTPKKLLSNFASRAFRRPVQPRELDRLVSLYRQRIAAKEPYEAAIQTCLEAVLTSPNFLFRVEAPVGSKGQRPLSDYELATRLSYFLWGTLPDSQLTTLAAANKLHDPKTLAAQVDRMLADSRSRNLGSDFAMQWLQLRKIENCSPDPRLFPDFTDTLRHDMLREVQSLFMDVVYQDKSVMTLVDRDTVFVNERLAKLYGLPPVSGDSMREVKSPDGTRGGLLGCAAVLTVTSNPNRTSPVKRGKWILEQILGTPPPSPPPNVGILPQDEAIKPTLPMKERLALHRKNPSCANCHRAMDAMGFSLERYDAIGRMRSKDGDLDIDSKGELPDGSVVDGVKDLQRLVLSRKKDFVRCLAEKLLTYASGRGMRPEDNCHLDKIVNSAEASGYKMHALILAVVQSDPFCKASSSPVVH